MPLVTVVAGAALACVVLWAGSAIAQQSDPEAGRTKALMCAPCHGLDGIGKNPMVPNLAGESALYISKQLRAFQAGERTHEQMSIIAQGLSDQDIADLAAWYSAIPVRVEMPQ